MHRAAHLAQPSVQPALYVPRTQRRALKDAPVLLDGLVKFSPFVRFCAEREDGIGRRREIGEQCGEPFRDGILGRRGIIVLLFFLSCVEDGGIADEDDHLVREEGGCLECLHQRVEGRHLLIADERIRPLLGHGKKTAQNRFLRAFGIVRLLAREEKDVRQIAVRERRHKVRVIHRR